MSIYLVHSKVAEIKEIPKAGWWIRFEGSWEFMFLGDEKPNLVKGQKIKIRIEPE